VRQHKGWAGIVEGLGRDDVEAWRASFEGLGCRCLWLRVFAWKVDERRCAGVGSLTRRVCWWQHGGMQGLFSLFSQLCTIHTACAQPSAAPHLGRVCMQCMCASKMHACSSRAHICVHLASTAHYHSQHPAVWTGLGSEARWLLWLVSLMENDFLSPIVMACCAISFVHSIACSCSSVHMVHTQAVCCKALDPMSTTRT
jgi:hypothetical protein